MALRFLETRANVQPTISFSTPRQLLTLRSGEGVLPFKRSAIEPGEPRPRAQRPSDPARGHSPDRPVFILHRPDSTRLELLQKTADAPASNHLFPCRPSYPPFKRYPQDRVKPTPPRRTAPTSSADELLSRHRARVEQDWCPPRSKHYNGSRPCRSRRFVAHAGTTARTRAVG